MTGRARHRVPFYIAAPTQTLDPSMPDGTRIPIEERAAEELTHFQGRQVAAPGIEVRARHVPRRSAIPARFQACRFPRPETPQTLIPLQRVRYEAPEGAELGTFAWPL
jgi:hypothetical protein